MRRPNLFVVRAATAAPTLLPRTPRRPAVVFLPKPASDPSLRAELTGHFAEEIDQREALIGRDVTGLRP